MLAATPIDQPVADVPTAAPGTRCEPRWLTMTGTVAASDGGHPATNARPADHVYGRGWVCAPPLISLRSLRSVF